MVETFKNILIVHTEEQVGDGPHDRQQHWLVLSLGQLKKHRQRSCVDTKPKKSKNQLKNKKKTLPCSRITSIFVSLADKLAMRCAIWWIHFSKEKERKKNRKNPLTKPFLGWKGQWKQGDGGEEGFPQRHVSHHFVSRPQLTQTVRDTQIYTHKTHQK